MDTRNQSYPGQRNLTLGQLKKYLIASAVLLGVMTGFGQRADAQQIAIRSNALNNILLTPDLGLEMVTGEHSSLSLDVFGHWKPYGIDSKLIAAQPQFRWWLGGRPLVREFLGIAGLFTKYDMTIGDRSYKGIAGGVGLTGGYVLSLGQRWGLEFSGGLGVVGFGQRRASRYDDFGDLDGDTHNSKGYKLMPMNLGVTFIYIIR